MEIREESPPKQRRSTLQFPELRDLKIGQVAVYDIAFTRKVRYTVAHLRRHEGMALKTIIDTQSNEIKVWVEESQQPEKED